MRLVPLLLVVLAACPAPVAAPDPYLADAEAEAFWRSYVRTVCEQRLACANGQSEFDVDACIAHVNAELPGSRTFGSPGVLERAIREHRVRVVAGATEACLAQLRQMDCGWLFITAYSELPECRAAFAGQVEAGVACAHPRECRPPASCRFPDPHVGGCDSICVSGECADDGDCPTGEVCSRYRWTCAAPKEDGQDCLDGSECRSKYCDSELVPGLNGTCRQRHADKCGGRCTAGEECREGGACVKVHGAGEACSGGDCAGSLACVPAAAPTGGCVPRAAAGEPCARIPCVDGLVCSEATLTCIAPGAAPCVRDWECGGSYCIDGNCVAPRAEGESCEGIVACGSGLSCDPATRVCVRAPSDGAACGRRCLGNHPRCGAATVCAAPYACNGGLCVHSLESSSCSNGAAGSGCDPADACLWDSEVAAHNTGNYRCVKRGGPGDSCGELFTDTGGGTCGAGLACAPDANGSPRCTPWGSVCGIGIICPSGTFCRADPTPSVCGPPPGEGAPCRDHCAPGLTCVGNALTGARCRHPPREGEPCERAFRALPCADPGNICVPVPEGGAKCVRSKRLGEACSTLFECGGILSENVCDLASGRCVPGPGEGRPCAKVRENESCDAMHAFCDHRPGNPTCHAFLPDGAPCLWSMQCGSRVGVGFCNSDGHCSRSLFYECSDD